MLVGENGEYCWGVKGGGDNQRTAKIYMQQWYRKLSKEGSLPIPLFLMPPV